jgi:hypothetical protein
MTSPRLPRPLVAALLAVTLGACQLLLDLSDPEPAAGDAAVADASTLPDSSADASSDASPDAEIDAAIDAEIDAAIDAEIDAAIDATPADAACVPTYSCAGNGRFNECTGQVEPCNDGLRCCVRGGGATCWPSSGCPG